MTAREIVERLVAVRRELDAIGSATHGALDRKTKTDAWAAGRIDCEIDHAGDGVWRAICGLLDFAGVDVEAGTYAITETRKEPTP